MLGRPALRDHPMNNIWFDTCVYHQAGIDLLFEVIDHRHILFGSEMVGAVRGIDPETGHYFDDTKRYVEALRLDARCATRSMRAMRGGFFPAGCATEGPRPMSEDIDAHLAALEDIPGTRVFTAARSRKGYPLNQFCMSLMTSENRARFKAGERAYLDEWPMSEAQKLAVLRRDYNAAIDEGGNIYFLAKIFSTDGQSFVQAVSTMTGATVAEHQAMMIAGGRSPEGLRSKREGR